MPCNPAVGGLAKSHLVAELDALGGEMGLNADITGLQYRTLNASRGPAVQAVRVQCDKAEYTARMARIASEISNLTLIEGTVVDLKLATISPENAKDAIVLENDNGELRFDLAWPSYGGFLPESIASIGELTGELDVSRDGGDGGYSMSYGRNDDGSYPNDSQRAVPKSSASVRMGTLNVDRYNQVAGIITNGESEEARLAALKDIGCEDEIAKRFISDQAAWLERDEVSGANNIDEGAKAAGHTVDSRFGYYGTTAPWVVGDLNLEGGSGQLDSIFSWGTLCDSGLIYDLGTAEIQ
jgi:hypothetical protein